MTIFLKLGGSLITHKEIEFSPRRDVILNLAREIKVALKMNPGLKIVIGHGSGSFGHVVGKKFNTRNGVFSPSDWDGFGQVWRAARKLNQIVVDALTESDLPIIAFPPSAVFMADNRSVHSGYTRPLITALEKGFIPLLNGDTVFDETMGGTILSTEEIFAYLATHLHPSRILLAGVEPGVWQDYPDCSRIIGQITPSSFSLSTDHIKGAKSTDVTGGMLEKVKNMLLLVQEFPGMEAVIFSGLEQNNLFSALCGDSPGTIIKND